MKKLFFSSALLLLFACGIMACSDALPTDDWDVPISPEKPATSVLTGSFESKFIRYTKGQKHAGQAMESKIVTTWRDTLWLNDRGHKQLVLWTKDKKYSNLTYVVSDLTSGVHRISASNINLRFPSYVMGDAKALDCGSYENRTTTLIADALSETPVTTLTTSDPIKIWITVNTPANVTPGTYTGAIIVKSDGVTQQTFNLELLIVNRQLPAVADWNFHLDLWQFPFQLTTLCQNNGQKIAPFSGEYFTIMQPFYQLLADAGQKTITTYIKDGAFNKGQTMVKWSKNSSDEWVFDYTDFDKYVETMMKWGIKKQISCFSLVGWNTSVGYTDASGTSRILELATGSDEYQSVWTDFLDSFKVHLTEKGWFDRAVLYMDEIREEEMKRVVSFIKAHDSSWKIGLSGAHVNSEVESSLYDYSTILGYDRQSTNAISTFYTSCSQQVPNNYVTGQTSPAEMPWMAWHALAKNYNGYLRWAYDYWTKPDPINIQDGSNASGDFNMIYRSDNTLSVIPISSIRLELLREGIQDYEKVHLLNNAQLNTTALKFTSTSGSEAVNLVRAAEELLKKISTIN